MSFTAAYVVGPTMAITSTTSGVTTGSTTNDATIALTFTASEAATGFVVGDISVTNGALSSFATVSSTVYTATFTPSGAGATTIDVAGNRFTDPVGNNNSAATQFAWTYDNVVPTMTITSTTSGVTTGSTTNDATIALTFTSSRATSTFAVGDITVTGGALSSFAATSSTIYTATFTPSAAGATTIDVDASTFTDSVGGNNNSAATQFAWTYDNVGPSIGIASSTVSTGATTNDATIALTFTSNEATSNFVVGDITVSGGSLSSFTQVNPSNYTATFTPSGQGATTIDVAINKFTDGSGNNNSAATQFAWTYDNVCLLYTSPSPRD